MCTRKMDIDEIRKRSVTDQKYSENRSTILNREKISDKISKVHWYGRNRFDGVQKYHF